MRSTIIYSTLLAIFSVSVLAQQVNHHDHAGRSLEVNFIHAERDLMIDSPQRLDEVCCSYCPLRSIRY